MPCTSKVEWASNGGGLVGCHYLQNEYTCTQMCYVNCTIDISLTPSAHRHRLHDTIDKQQTLFLQISRMVCFDLNYEPSNHACVQVRVLAHDTCNTR